MKIPNTCESWTDSKISLARIVSEDSQPLSEALYASLKSSKDS